jgi:CheY-like chemotaxis protein
MNKPKVLIVEDEAIVAADLGDRLRSLGYDVVGPVDTADEAIRTAGELKPDLVLMDIMLKGDRPGTEAAAHIRTELSIPVVYLTASSNDTTFIRARDTEPFGFILKPYEEATLRVNIEIALYKHRMEQEREGLIRQLQAALAEVRALSGMIPICAWCKNVRSDKGYWQSVEEYVRAHTDAKFSHGMCPDCEVKFRQELLRRKGVSDPSLPPVGPG